MKFSYTALSKSNKKLNGLLESGSLENAKEELHKMGLSIVSIREISESEYIAETAKQKAVKEVKGVRTFLFQATDNKGKDVQGTIDALSLENACERLVREYQFTVHSLFPEGSGAEEQKTALGALKELTQRYKAEQPRAEALEDQESDAVDKKIVQEIDQVIQKTKEALSKYAALFNADHQNELRIRLAELERIRQSNNLNHIAEVCHKIYERLQSPDEWEQKNGGPKEDFQEMLHSMGENALINKSSALYQKVITTNRIRTLGQSIMESIGRLRTAAGVTGKGRSRPALTPIVADNETPGLKKILHLLKAYLTAGNPVIRQTRKHDLIKAWRAWREFKKQQKEIKKQNADARSLVGEKQKNQKWALLLDEIDSFISWLLVFYLAYLFFAAFTLEKGGGWTRNFVFKTMGSPLLINITLFLWLSHFIFFIQKRFLREQWWASLFLFSVAYSGYLLLLINF